jgi:CRISPR-associated endonuclease/helicase Cas3
VQAAGRCNREGKEELGRVVIFEPEEGSEPKGEYASATDEARRLLWREELDLHDPDIFREYFSRLYMDRATDAKSIQELRRRLDYPEVAERFRMIPEDTVPVIVQYPEKDSRREERRVELISRIQREGALRPGDHRRLQPYVVGLRRHELQKMEWMTQDIAEGVKLWVSGYDKVRGISALSTDPADLVW